MFPAVIDARVEAAFKLESKMSLHGFKALQEKSKNLGNFTSGHLPFHTVQW